MVTEIYATGKTINEAIDALKAKLCVSDLDGTEWKVVSVGKKGGLFGLGAQPAKVVAFIEAKEEEKPAPKAEPVVSREDEDVIDDDDDDIESKEGGWFSRLREKARRAFDEAFKNPDESDDGDDY